MAEYYTLGIDGGGTKTEAVIIDELEQVAGVGLGGGSNCSFITHRAAVDSFVSAIRAALSSANLEPSDITCGGCTFGGAAKAAFEEVGIAVEPMPIAEHRVALERACITATSGVVLVAGTGSSCLAFSGEDKRTHSGGWGALLGDEGSAYDIGLRGIKRAMYAADGRLPATALTDAVCEYFQVDRVLGVVKELLGERIQQAKVAGFAVKVCETARAGDEAALQIIEEAGETLGELIAHTARRVLSEEDEFPIVLAGGVFNAGDLIIGPIRCVVAPQFPRARVLVARMSPGEAAARLARREFVRRKKEC